MKTGRNETCPCGSGMKYKQCCLLKESEEKSGNRLIREIEASLMERMLPFADEVFGDDAIDQALLLFLDNEEKVGFEEDDPLNPLFLPWFLYSWVIEAEEEKPSPSAPLNKTIAEAYMEAKSHDLSAEAIELIKASISRPLSFYEVIASVPGKSLTLNDLLQQKSIEVDDDAASTSLRSGEIVIGAMMQPLSGKIRALMLGPFALQADHKNTISTLRAELMETTGKKELDEAILIQQEAFVLGHYLDILDEMLDADEDVIQSPSKHRSPALAKAPKAMIKPKK